MTFPARLDELIAKATKGPFFVSGDDASDCPPHKNSGLAMIDTGRVSDWPLSRLCEWHDAHLIAYLVNHAEAIRDLVVAADNIIDAWDADSYEDFMAAMKSYKAIRAKLEEA